MADESYGPTDADMTPQLTNIKGTAGIQAVLNPGFGQGPSIVTRNYQQLAVGLPLYQSHGVASKGFIDLAGAERGRGRAAARHRAARRRPARRTTTRRSRWWPPTSTDYEAAYGEAPSTFGGYAHDAFAILADAIARAGSSRARGDPRRDRGDLGPRRDHRRRAP